jgi:ribosomal protein S17E
MGSVSKTAPASVLGIRNDTLQAVNNSLTKQYAPHLTQAIQHNK